MTNTKKGPALSIIPAVAVDDANLSPAAFMMLATLGTHTSTKADTCWPSQKILSQRLNWTQQAVSKYLNELIGLGYITTSLEANPQGKGRKITVYKVIYDYALPPKRYKEAQAPQKLGSRRPKEQPLVVEPGEVSQLKVVKEMPNEPSFTTQAGEFHNSGEGVSQLNEETSTTGAIEGKITSSAPGQGKTESGSVTTPHRNASSKRLSAILANRRASAFSPISNLRRSLQS